MRGAPYPGFRVRRIKFAAAAACMSMSMRISMSRASVIMIRSAAGHNEFLSQTDA